MNLALWVGTPPSVVRKMLQMAQVGAEDVLYDLGCGDARILIMAVQEFGAKEAVGYEIRQDLCEASWRAIKHQDLQNRIVVIKGDLVQADISEASVIILYLSSIANELLRPRFEKELKCGTRIVSLIFKINAWRTSDSVYVAGGLPIYLYTIPKAFK